MPVAGHWWSTEEAPGLHLARFFGTTERFWINLQSRYGLEIEIDRIGDVFDGIRPLTAAC